MREWVERMESILFCGFQNNNEIEMWYRSI